MPLSILALMLAVVLLYWWTRRPASDAELRERFRRELPVGSTPAEIKAWAARHGVAPQWRQDNPATVALPGSMLELLEFKLDENSTYVECVIPWGRFWTGSELAPNHLWVYITLDASGNVRGHYVLSLQQLAEHERRIHAPLIR